MIDVKYLVTMITGVSELAYSLQREAYSMTPQGIFKRCQDLTEGQNAIEYVDQYSELTGAALQVIGGAMGVISDLLLNGDAEIVFTKK